MKTTTQIGLTAGGKYRLGGPMAWWIWIIVTVFTIYLFNVQTMFSVVQGDIKTTLHLDDSHLTMIAATYTWAFAIFQFFGGAFLDCFGSRKVLIPAFIFVTAGVFLYGIATSYAMILLAQVLMALGACCGFVGAGYIGGVWFGMAAYGTMFGYVQVLSSLSSAIQQPITEKILTVLSYEKLFVYLGFFGLLLVVLAILYMRNPTPVTTHKSPFKVVGSNLLQIIKKPQMWIAALWGGIAFGLNLALGVVWTPKIFTNAGFTLDNGNLGSALLWLGLAAGSCFWPKWSDKIHSRRIPSMIGVAMMLLGLILAIYVKMPLWLLYAMMFIIGMGATSHMLAFTIGGDVAGGPLVGTSSAFLNGIMFIFGGILQNIPSHLQGTGAGIHTMFLPFIIAAGIALIFVFIQKETAPAK
ncbi:MAG: MFS transporter [Muribaculaceae bacterium]|nr:MFS transporter [Muribaculaceae bacterium]